MKTLGRVLIILAVFGVVMGVTYGLVTAASAAGVVDRVRFELRRERSAQPGEGQQPVQPPREERRETRGRVQSPFRSALRLVFGGIKNTVVIAVIVAAVVMPKAWLQKRRKASQSSAG